VEAPRWTFDFDHGKEGDLAAMALRSLVNDE
jgi:hypothetical protein